MFYTYLNNLDNETLIKIENNLTEKMYNLNELQEIYLNVLKEKKISTEKKNLNFNLDNNQIIQYITIFEVIL